MEARANDWIRRGVRSLVLMILVLFGWLALPFTVMAQEASSLPEDNITVQYWMIVTGFFLPLALAFIQQSRWSIATQSAVAFGAAIVVTLVQMYVYGQLDNFTDPAQAVLLVLALTITFYKGWWKPTGIAPRIEAATNVG